MKRLAPGLTLLLLLFSLAPSVFAERLSPEKLLDLGRVGDAAVSPDGTQLAYLVTSPPAAC